MLRPLLALVLIGSVACAAEPRAEQQVRGGIGLVGAPEDGAIDLGMVGRRATAAAQLRLRNDGSVARPVTARIEGHPAFRVPPRIDLPPGATVPLTVVVRPDALGPIEATLHVELDPPLAFRVTATVVQGCLDAPTTIELGVTPEGCVGDQAAVDVANGCDHPLRLLDIEAEGDEIYLASQPVLPRQLEPGEAITLRLLPTPRWHGASESTIRISDDAGAPLEIALSQESPARALTHDLDIQGIRPDADRLYVIDDSPAMAPYPDVLDSLAAAVDAALPAIDARIGVTTTSRLAVPGCPSSGADGRLVPVDGSARRVLDRPELIDGRLHRRLDGAGCSSEPNRAFAAAERAILLTATRDDPDHPEEDDGNLGFRREGVPLQVVFVAADDDASGGTIGDWYARFAELRDRFDLRFAALVAGPAGCDAPARDSRVAALVRALGGQVLPFCGGATELGWTPLTREWSHRTVFPLTQVPLDRDLDGEITEAGDGFAVHVDGAPVEQLDETGALRYRVTQTPAELIFEPAFAPEERQVVEITYLPLCR